MRCRATILLAVLAAFSAVADDAVGLTRIAVPSNDVAAAVLPYAPLGSTSTTTRFRPTSGPRL